MNKCVPKFKSPEKVGKNPKIWEKIEKSKTSQKKSKNMGKTFKIL